MGLPPGKENGWQQQQNCEQNGGEKMHQQQEVASGSNNKIQYINKGEDDQMEIYGYRFSNLRSFATWVGYFFTLGLLRLFFHWYPQFRLFSTHSRTSLQLADKVLIIDDYKGKYKTYFVKDVKTLSAKLLSKRKDSDTENFKTKAPRLSINLNNGNNSRNNKGVTDIRAFWCKKLCYIWDDDQRNFIKLVGLDKNITNLQIYEYKGFDSNEQFMRRITYGRNEIDVPLQTILTLLVLEALTPFYIFQVFSLIVWCAENYYYYTIAIIVMSIFGIGSSIIQTRKNQKNLRGTVQSTDKITVCRGGDVFEDISTCYLVPGDVIVIPTHGCIMHCDAVLLNGNCIVNESMLTGESVPVTKTPLPKINKLYDVKEDANHTLFCGTKVIQTRYYGDKKVMAVVLRTGYLTSKGQLIRSIMYPPPADFKFDQDSYKFIGILAVVALCGVIYTVVSKSTRDNEPIDILIKALDLITIVIPPALPAAMTVGKLYALHRLKRANVYCINSRIINVSGSINCVCFDKTGTLTEDGLDMWGVASVDEDNQLTEPLKFICTLPLTSQFLRGMACCHSLTLIDGELMGDPLDVKMFEATEWFLEEPNIADHTKFDLIAPTIVKPPRNRHTPDLEMGIIHQFQFSSTLQRMSVVTKTLGDNNFQLFCKGSPEMLKTLCKEETMPKDLFERLKEFTKKGYRVIALANKSVDLNFVKIQKSKREELEKDLNFLGLIILENRLKPQTNAVIETLKSADIKLIMITGDNIQTAVSVARECGIIDSKRQLVDVTVDALVPTMSSLKFTPAEELDDFQESLNGSTYVKEPIDLEKGSKNNPVYAVSGTTWEIIRQHHSYEIPKIVANGAVFARMSSEQKQQLILELQALGYYVAMCGDGANDCGALKAAHVGISLSEAEASVASPFTAKDPNIQCVPKIVKEGRAALVTSFGVFKFMICYSLTEFTSAIILYGIDANLNSLQYLFIDICLILNFASFFGITKAWEKTIVKTPPMTSLLSLIPLLSIIFNIMLVVAFQAAAYHLIQTYEFFEAFIYNNNEQMNFNSFENYAVFTMSLFQYIIMAIVFSKGKPYRKPIFSNIFLSISLLLSITICAYITLSPSEWVISTLELKLPPVYEARLLIIGLATANFFVAWFFEDFFLEIVLQKIVRRFTRSNEENSNKTTKTNKQTNNLSSNNGIIEKMCLENIQTKL